MKIYEVHGLSGLKSIKSQWQDLVRQIDRQHFFHQWEWHYAYLSSLLETPESVSFIVVTDNDRDGIVAVFPYSVKEKLQFGHNFRVLCFPAHIELILSDMISGKNDFKNIFEQILLFLKKKKDIKWDYLRLTGLRKDSNIIENQLNKSIKLSFSNYTSPSAYINCKSNIEISKYISAKFKRNINRLRKRAEQKGSLSIHYISDDQYLPDAYIDFLKTEKSGWKGGEGKKTAIFFDNKKVSFYKSIIENFAKTQRSQINLLKINNQCAAAQLCVINGSTLNILKIGYDESLNDCAPGNLLLFDLINKCSIDDKIKIISFVTGPSWTRRWHADEIDVYESLIFNGTVKSRFLYNLYKVKLFLDSKNQKIGK